MLRQGMIERFKKAVPIIRELVDDLAWIQNEFNPENATEEERTYVKHLLVLGSNCFDESDWRLKRMFAVAGKKGRLIRNSAGRIEMEGTDIEFTCGSSCEVYAPYFSDEKEWMTWLPTSIEYDKGYYFTARPDMKLDGALVRVKGRWKIGCEKSAISWQLIALNVKICYKQISFSNIYYSRFSLDLYRKFKREDLKFMKIFSFINKKGGVGKTTITVNMAYAIAESCDLRVLIIDNDDQGNDSQFFDADSEKSLADILLAKADIKDVIQPTRYPKIDIVASGAALLDANVAVIKDEDIVQQTILKETLKKVADHYDICLIDNPPTINASVINALVASDEVIIVTTPDIYGIRGVSQMADYIEAIKEYNPLLRFRGCLLNKFSSTPHGFRCINLLEKRFPLFRTRIRYTKDKLEASAEERKSIFEYSPNCGFARDLVQFLKELLAGE